MPLTKEERAFIRKPLDERRKIISQSIEDFSDQYTLVAAGSMRYDLAQYRAIKKLYIPQDILFQYGAGDGLSAATFTRGSTATFFNASGVMQTAGSGVARDAHYIGGNRTLLLEEQRMNLCLRSEEFDNASWVKTNITITPNALAAPNGESTAELLTEGSAGTAEMYQGVSVTAATAHTYSIFLKAGNATWIRFRLKDNSGADAATVWVNLATGALGTQTQENGTPAGTVRIDPIGNGWYRVAFTKTFAIATTVRLTINSASADLSSTRVAGATYYCWGAHVGPGTFALSYIATTGATVTRAVDSLSFAQAVAPVNFTQYERYWNIATAAWVESVSTIVGGSNYPAQPVVNRAYRDIIDARGVRNLAYFQALVAP